MKSGYKRILSGALALTLSMTLTVPALAVEEQKVSVKTATQSTSVQDAIQTVRNTVDTINQMKANGTVSDSKLSELAIQLGNLERVATGKEITSELVQLVQDAEKAISGYGTSGAIKAQAALAMLKMNLGIPDTFTVENKEAGAVLGFDDVETTHWAYKDIMTMVNKGAISGTRAPVNGLGHFEPTGTVSLGQFLAIATRLVAPDKIGQQIEGEHWAMSNYRAAIEAGIITRNDFLPTSLDTSISRQDMAFILVNIAKINGETLNITENIENNINDYSAISQHREIAVKQAYSNGLLSGKDGGKFDPQGTAKRAEISAVFCRVMNYVTRPPVTVKDTPTDDKIIMGGYVSNDGDAAGRLLSKYSRQYDLEALSSTKMGADSKGVYVTFTAPQLPSEISSSFHYVFTSRVYKSNGDYFANPLDVELKSGESKTLYFETFEGGAVTKDMIGSANVAVRIANDKGQEMLMHSAESTNKSTSVEVWFNGTSDILNYDSTAIFNGIGK